MSNRTSRRKKVVGVALSAATLAATFTAFAPSAGAQFAPGEAGTVRVTPANPAVLSQDQTAPIIFADKTDQPGADIQLEIGHQWENNDRILLAVTNSDGTNCVGADPAEGALAYTEAPTVSVAGPFDVSLAPVMGASNGSPDIEPAIADTAVPAPAATPPKITATLSSSTQCAGTATDLIELRFTGESDRVDATESFVITLSDVSYDVARLVPAGPIHNVPYGEDATGATTWIPDSVFGDNTAPGYDDPVIHADPTGPGATHIWTNGAFVSPVNATVGTPNQLSNDGTRQALGTVTISEIQADAFRSDGVDDTLTLDFSNLSGMNVLPDPVIEITDKAGTAAEIVSFNWVDGNTLEVTYNIDAAGTDVVGSIEISGLFATPVVTGPVDLTVASPHFTAAFFTPDDNTFVTLGSGADEAASDVNLGGPLKVEAFANVVNDGTRIGGNDRYETAANIAAAGVSACSNYAVVASGEDFPDALSANYLAGALNARFGDEVPVLLTRSDSLPNVTVSSLRQLGAGTVYVVGGPNAISDDVVAEISGLTDYFCGGIAPLSPSQIDVSRISGPNRYSTNNEVNQFAAQVNFGDEGRRSVQLHFGEASESYALLATGTEFADALTAGPLATTNFPLVLTTPDSLSPQAVSTLNSLDVDNVIILGGTAAVSQAVEDAVVDTGRGTMRLAGANRFETAAAIADFARTPATPTADTGGDYDAGLGYGAIESYLTNAFNFADALAGGTLAGYSGINLMPTGQASLNATAQAWLEANATALDLVKALGLGAAVSTTALDEANAAVS